MYRSESWIINKVEHWKIDAFKFWYWRRLLRGSWDSKEIKLVNPKINHSWIFPGRADAEAEATILWSPNAKKWLIGKDPDSAQAWGQEHKWVTENEMIRWPLNEHKFEQTLGDSDGQEVLVFCSPWAHKELDTTERLNSNNSLTRLTVLSV